MGGDMGEVIGYRNPFVFIGAKGLAPGTAHYLLDKRAQSKTVLRLDAMVISSPASDASSSAASSSGPACPVQIVDVKDYSINAKDKCPDREKQGWTFKNSQTIKKKA